MCVCENENTVFVGFTVFEQNFPEQNGIHLQNVLYWGNSTTVQHTLRQTFSVGTIQVNIFETIRSELHV